MKLLARNFKQQVIRKKKSYVIIFIGLCTERYKKKKEGENNCKFL